MAGRQPCEAKSSTRQLRCLKPLGFVNTTTLGEIYARLLRGNIIEEYINTNRSIDSFYNINIMQ
ncbi:hypothetical protein PUR_42300 [Paenibacillus sp. URB8-2]|nr:hypothetical protein PUR_42300 [Paenibacillus sp. URB8-2]